MNLCAGLVLALAAALALNVGFFIQHGAAHAMHSLSLRHPLRAVRLLVSNRQWMAGYAAGWVGWGFYIAALRLAPLSLVQAVAAGGVGILAFLAHRVGTPLGSRERCGAWIAVGGLVLLGVSLSVGVPTVAAAHNEPLLIVIVGGVVAAAFLATVGARTGHAGISLGSAAGLLFGVGDLATKGAVSGNGLVLVPVFAACTALGFVVLQMSFQRGGVLETAGISAVNNMIPIMGGLLLFHEHLPHGAAGVARLVSFGAVVVGAVLLARAPDSPGQRMAEPPREFDGTHPA